MFLGVGCIQKNRVECSVHLHPCTSSTPGLFKSIEEGDVIPLQISVVEQSFFSYSFPLVFNGIIS